MNAFIIFPCFRASKALWCHVTICCFLFPVFLLLLLLLFSTFFLAFLHSNHSLLASTPSLQVLPPQWLHMLFLSAELLLCSSAVWNDPNLQVDCWASEVFTGCKGHPKHVRQYWALLVESFWMHEYGFREKQGHEMEWSRVLLQLLGEISPLA